MDYPRVLVVANNPFNETRNNGITTSNLFRGWPKDRLAQIYFPLATPIAPDYTVCDNFWAVTPVSVLKGLTGADVNGRVQAGVAQERAPRGFGSSLIGRMVGKLAQLQPVIEGAEPLRDALFSLPTVLSPSLGKWARDFAPDVVYSTLGTVPAMNITNQLADMLGVPVAPHVTDDWPGTLYMRSRPLRLLRKRVDRAFAGVLARSTVRLVISERMAEEYEKRYGGEYLAFPSVADGSRFDPTPRAPHDGPVRFTFMGGVHLERWRSLREIALALETLRDQGVDAVLDIYTFPDHVEAFSKHFPPRTVTMKGWVPYSEIPGIIAQSDVLVHVESFVPEIAAYTRLSLSTKLPEYLLSGRPILAYGPGDGASVSLPGRTGAGISVGEQDPAALLAAVRRLAEDREHRVQLGLQARRVGELKHEAVLQRERFREALARSAANGRPATAPPVAARVPHAPSLTRV